MRECFDVIAKSKSMPIYYQIQVFDLPFNLPKSAFSQSVMNTLLKIPYTETRNYTELALMCGYPKAYHAVSLSYFLLKFQPHSFILPCHRIICSN